MQREPESPWLTVALTRVAAASARLTPGTFGAQLAGVAQRAWSDSDAVASALAGLGVVERPLAITRLGGGRSNAVYRVDFADRRLVLKRSLPVGTVLALAARWLGSQPFARDQGLLANARMISPAGRSANEARALAMLGRAGIRVPGVVATSPRAGLLLVEYVDGVPLPSTLAGGHAARRIAGYARALRAVHAAGVTLGDCHPGNALVESDGAITLIDLEHAELDHAAGTFAARCAFDLAFAAAYFTGPERAVFLDAARGDAAVAEAAAGLDRFAWLFALERRRQRTQEAA